jgi:hypothetical protein
MDMHVSIDDEEVQRSLIDPEVNTDDFRLLAQGVLQRAARLE